MKESFDSLDSGPLRPRTICIKPRHQRARWVMYSFNPSGASPIVSRSLR
ncbi:hypothetical protein ABH973_004138 [Bradyrhizobium ottawaense]